MYSYSYAYEQYPIFAYTTILAASFAWPINQPFADLLVQLTVQAVRRRILANQLNLVSLN